MNNERRTYIDPYTGTEILREESPDRLIELFKEQTGMRSLEDLEISNYPTVIPVRESYASITGAVVIGSCTREEAFPKDLDVIIVGNHTPSGRIADYVYELAYNFNLQFALKTKEIDRNIPLGYQIEQGRIDILDYLHRSQTDGNETTRTAIQNTENPKVFSYTLEQAEEINHIINGIKNE